MSTVTISIPKITFSTLSEAWISAVKSVPKELDSVLLDKSTLLHNVLEKNATLTEDGILVAKFKSNELQDTSISYSEHINTLPVETKTLFSKEFSHFWTHLCLHMTLEE